MTEFLFDVKNENLTGQKLFQKFEFFFKTSSLANFDQYLNKRTSIDLFYEKFNSRGDSIEFVINEKNNIQIPFSIGLISKDNEMDVMILIQIQLGKILFIKTETIVFEINPNRYT